MKKTALPVELIRCYERADGKKVSLMYRRDVPQYRTMFLSRAIELYTTWRLFEKAPPSGGGWANERNTVVKVLRLLEAENNKYDAWEREKEDARRQNR